MPNQARSRKCPASGHLRVSGKMQPSEKESDFCLLQARQSGISKVVEVLQQKHHTMLHRVAHWLELTLGQLNL